MHIATTSKEECPECHMQKAMINKKECPNCNGKGTWEKDHGHLCWDEKCDRCNGLGYIEETITITRREYDELIKLANCQ